MWTQLFDRRGGPTVYDINIFDIYNITGFRGGIMNRVTGSNLDIIQNPRMVVYDRDRTFVSVSDERIGEGGGCVVN